MAGVAGGREAPQTYRVEVVVGPTGRGVVKVDGRDLSDIVASVAVVTAVGEVTRVVLELVDVDVYVDAEAEILMPEGLPEGPEGRESREP